LKKSQLLVKTIRRERESLIEFYNAIGFPSACTMNR